MSEISVEQLQAERDALASDVHSARLFLREKDGLLRELAEAKNERDALAAKLAELEGQEPVQIDEPDYHWEAMGCGLEDRNITDRYEAMKHGWDCAIDRMLEQISEPLYARPVPADRPVNARLLDVATGKIPHLFAGICPDAISGSNSRDPECPACRVIAAAESAPKAVRLKP